MSQVLRTSQAHLDLIEIGLYIAYDNPAAADRLLEAIDETCRLLSSRPELGRKRPDLAPEVRSFPVRGHVIFYRCVAEGIQILRVLHGARDIPAQFENL
jgi:toxin ParE1/3/4